MPLVNITDIANNTDATADVFNTRFAAILNVLNGNIDAANLANGAVTLPKIAAGVLAPANLTTSYKFCAHLSTQPTYSGAAVKVAYAAEDYDTSNNYDSVTNYRFTAPVAGYYWFAATLQVMEATASNIDVALSLYKNGTRIRKGGNIKGAAYPQPYVSGLFYLAQGDYVEVFFTSVLTGVVIENSVTSNYFEGRLVTGN